MEIADRCVSLALKSSKGGSQSDNCIITVLDANDLPPLNSNLSSTLTSGNDRVESNATSPQITRNRRYERNPSRNVFHRFFIYHRPEPTSTPTNA